MNPEAVSSIQSFRRRADSAPLYGRTKGAIRSEVNSRRYMAWTEAGAEDHLIKMAENEMAIIPISMSNATGTGGFWYSFIRSSFPYASM